MIKVLFFAALRERLHCDHYTAHCSTPTTVESLLLHLQQHNEQWQQALSGTELLCAINQTMVSHSAEVVAGDEVAFFPPVTGG